LPIGPNKVPEVAELAGQLEKKGCQLRVLFDHPGQIEAAEKYNSLHDRQLKWSAFIKVDAGNK
jgi:hypothetical protein